MQSSTEACPSEGGRSRCVTYCDVPWRPEKYALNARALASPTPVVAALIPRPSSPRPPPPPWPPAFAAGSARSNASAPTPPRLRKKWTQPLVRLS